MKYNSQGGNENEYLSNSGDIVCCVARMFLYIRIFNLLKTFKYLEKIKTQCKFLITLQSLSRSNHVSKNIFRFILAMI